MTHDVHSETEEEVQATAVPELEDSTGGLPFDEIRPAPVETAIAGVDDFTHDSPAHPSDKNILAVELDREHEEDTAQSPTSARSQSNERGDESHDAIPAGAVQLPIGPDLIALLLEPGFSIPAE